MAQKKTSPSSTSSRASEDLASGLKQPDLFGQLPSVSKTPSAKPSSESTGPMSRSTTMSEPSTQMDLEELTSSAEVFRVNPGPQPGSSEAQKMTVTSGRSWLPLLKTYGLDGSLGKMCEAVLTNRWASNAAFLTWKASATAPSHLLFQLAPSMPRTDETEFGFWPTATGQDNAQVRGVGKTKGTKRGTTLGGAVRMWPTPTANEDAAGTPAGKMQGMLGNHPDIRGTTPEEWSRGSLNPAWVEWLMGFPTGHTDLKPSEMPSSRKSSRKSDAQSSRQRARDVR